MSKKLHNNDGETDSFDELLTLTPRVLEGKEKERIQPYLKRLKQAIDQNGIRNVALTGNYGSGKSTILKTFEDEYSEHEYLFISLASFTDYKTSEEQGSNGDEEQNGNGDEVKKEYDIISREITFIYAVKDTLFKDKTERVKFFDFIIPVIPFINSKNASEQLNKLVQKHDLSDKLSNRFISELVSFIHDIDMRLLINTFHEYNVFKENIDDSEINQEQLFSIIVYKNLYPEDFSKLYHNEGKLYEVLNKREVHISALVRELDSKISTLDKKIEEIDDHKHIQVNELRSVYILKLLESLSHVNIQTIFTGERDVSIFELRKDEYFGSLKNSENVQYTREGYRRSSSNIPFRQIEDKVDNNRTYDEREELILGRNNNLSNSIRNETQDIRKRISKIRQLSLSEIITEINSEDVYGYFVNNDLVKFLLNGGYISENYSDYISLFHEQDLTRDEFKFRNNIKRLKEPDFEFKIENHFNFLKDLGERYFSRPQILNYDLIEYLISSNIFISNKKIFYSSLDNRDQNYLDFIIGFIDKKPSCRKEFISNLIKNRKSIWDEVFHGKNLPDEKILEVTGYMFEYSTSDNLADLNNIKSFRDYISNLETPITFGGQLNISTPFKQFITTQSVKFKTLELLTSENEEIFKFVVNNNCFKISYHNFKTILNSNLINSELTDTRNAIFSSLTEIELPAIKNYAEGNINEFVSKVLLYEDISDKEDENALIELLNNEDLELQYKTDLLSIQQNKISSLEDLNEKQVIEMVLETNRISPTWRNIFYYYHEILDSSLNQIIINFLNTVRNYSILSDSSIFDIDQEESVKTSFRDSIFYCKDLNPEAYESLLNAITPLPPLDASLLSPNMAEAIVTGNYLEFNSINFDQLKSIQGNLHIRLIKKHIQEFVKGYSDITLENSDWYLLLKSKKINSSNKEQLVSHLTNRNFSDQKISKKVIELHPNKRLASIGFEELKTILSHENSLEGRISLLLLYISILDDNQLKTIVSKFGEDYADLFGLWKMPSFPNHEPNYLLLKDLEERGIISSVAKKGEKVIARCLRKK